MDTSQLHHRSLAVTAVRAVSVPTLVGATLGAVAAVLLPLGHQGAS